MPWHMPFILEDSAHPLYRAARKHTPQPLVSAPLSRAWIIMGRLAATTG
jgi:hypothetical protein